jgi:hypothetical protein
MTTKKAMTAVDYQKYYEKQTLNHRRAQVKKALLLEKAKKAGITVTPAEIDAALKTK